MSVKNLSNHIATRKKTQKVTSPSKPVSGMNQVKNTAGGYIFSVGKWEQLDRFLILGSEGGTFYVNERKLTVNNAQNVIQCIKEDGFEVVDRIVAVSKAGRAPKNDPALLALALCVTYGKSDVKNYAMSKLSDVARIGTHLFHFAEFANSMRGWGRILREGIRNWYQEKDVSDLANQVIKYQQRDGWSHKDLIRLSHPKAEDTIRNNLYRYIVKGPEAIEKGQMMPRAIIGAELIKTATVSEAIRYINEYNLPREVVPTHLLNDVNIWATLLQKDMPITALIRNLGKMSSVGLFDISEDYTDIVVKKLNNEDVLRKGRVHPLNVLVAMKTYAQGHGEKGSLVWKPKKSIINALDDTFYLSFGAIEPSGKNTLLALDVSGSMSYPIANMGISCREAAAAMAMVTARTEKNWEVMGFGTTFKKLPEVTPAARLDTVVNHLARQNFGGTDCSLPMIWAMQEKVEVDTFVVYTDNETWAGKMQPFQALRQYREKMGRNARLIVVGMIASPFTIADPNDGGMLDVVGFDTATPNVISAFSSGDF